MMRLQVSRWGRIEREQEAAILGLMEECYARLQPHEVELVEVHLFEHTASLEGFLLSEQRRLGVAGRPFMERFFAFHDAWRGIPRISIAMERMREVSERLRATVVQHEVGHSILHGSIVFYTFTLPRNLMAACHGLGLSQEYATDLLYLASIAVKDFEVTRLLQRHGYGEDQQFYMRQMLEASKEDRISWAVAQGNAAAEILCLVGRLKDLGCTAPFLADPNLKDEVRHGIAAGLSYLPADHAARLLQIASQLPTLFTGDTHDSVRRLCDSIAEELVTPLGGK